MATQDLRGDRQIFQPGDTLDQAQIHALAGALQALAPQNGFLCIPGIACICVGDDDCNDMFKTNACSREVCFVGDNGGVVCVCVRA